MFMIDLHLFVLSMHKHVYVHLSMACQTLKYLIHFYCMIFFHFWSKINGLSFVLKKKIKWYGTILLCIRLHCFSFVLYNFIFYCIISICVVKSFNWKVIEWHSWWLRHQFYHNGYVMTYYPRYQTDNCFNLSCWLLFHHSKNTVSPSTQLVLQLLRKMVKNDNSS